MTTPIRAANLAPLDGITHGFFTREGGVSEGIYAGLNVGLGSDDARDAVMENRARVASALGHPGAPLNTLHQVHSASAVAIDTPLGAAPPKADGIVTATPGLIIGALAADCTPVLFADANAGIIGAAHAGWRGAVGGVLEATITSMIEMGATRSGIHAAVGPTIMQPSYEVGPEFEDNVRAQAPNSAGFFKRFAGREKPHFDLPGFVCARLAAAELASVTNNVICTYANEARLFSYRRATHRAQTDYGRQISAIVLT